MKYLIVLEYATLFICWLYILLFSINELKKVKSKYNLIAILFIILSIDAFKTIIETSYFGIRLASQYKIIPIEFFNILSNPYLLFLPKVINVIAAILIIFLMIKKWYPQKIKEDEKLKLNYEKEKQLNEELEQLNKNLDNIVKEKTKELEKLNNELEEKIKIEVEKNKVQEQKLFNQSKLASMGEMLNNISHQWKQPLSTISVISSGTKLRQELGLLKSEELIKDMDNITLTTQHMADTIMGFQNYFKPQYNNGKIAFKDMIDNTIRILHPMLEANNIQIIKNVECNCTIEAQFNEFTQILINLINNSKDAFLHKDIDLKLVKIETSNNDNICTIKVTDNAGGIPIEIIDRIFEPYFTTKHQYNGTGLGLYMIKELIEKHLNGTIEVENVKFEHDKKIYDGARFTVISKFKNKQI